MLEPGLNFVPTWHPRIALPSSCYYSLANDKGGHYVKFSHSFAVEVVLSTSVRVVQDY